jgi:hypothetical protein
VEIWQAKPLNCTEPAWTVQDIAVWRLLAVTAATMHAPEDKSSVSYQVVADKVSAVVAENTLALVGFCSGDHRDVTGGCGTQL